MRPIMVLWAVWYAYWLLAGPRTERARLSQTPLSRGLFVAVLVGGFFMMFSDVFHKGLMGERLWPQAPAVSAAGIGLTAAGLLFCVWARAHLGRYWSGKVQIKEGHRLITTGPYAFVRHPIYTGFLLAIVGSAAALGEVRGLVIIACMTAAYWRKLRMEEEVLGREFGREYEDYRARTKALIPFIV